MSGKTQYAAARQMQYLLKNSLSGTMRSKKRLINQAKLISIKIWCRWHVMPSNWKLKHVLWYLNHAIKNLSQFTQYSHYLTITRIIKIQKNEQWLGRLSGRWTQPKN